MTETGTFEYYRLAVKMADRISARRLVTNSFFLSLQAALATLAGSALLSNSFGIFWGQLALTLVGLAASSIWWLALKSYRDLNAAKFKVISEMESKLPEKIFSREWDLLKADPISKWRPRYAELGTAERVIPFVFAVVFVLQFIGRILS